MTHGSLFSGIGGFDLAAEWMGWENVFHCEINPFGRKVLNHYWPQSISYEDIKKTDFSIHRGQIDILSGGFPCQPFSLAGQRKGAEDDRYLWPEMLRAIDEVRPSWVVGENVAGIVSMVQPETVEVNLESQADIFGEINHITLSEQQQYVVETVCRDLEYIGYSVQPVIIPACAVGAPHKRDRIWFIANAPSNRRSGERQGSKNENGKSKSGVTRIMEGRSEGLRFQEPTSCAYSLKRRKRGMHTKRHEKTERYLGACNSWESWPAWENFPTQSPICSRNDGVSTRLDGITFSKWRNESIKAYGNAVVPQIVYEIFKAIKDLTPLPNKEEENKKI